MGHVNNESPKYKYEVHTQTLGKLAEERADVFNSHFSGCTWNLSRVRDFTKLYETVSLDTLRNIPKG